jgi:lipoprotein-releasing system permease protein
MFELSVASKYLRPRWRQLSVSIISLISILVIALVVWLIVVFFSVTYGLEKRWVEKLIALTAPIRIIPTDAYYNSYYYQIDSLSEKSNYGLKTIGEKWRSAESDPYDPNSDVEVPVQWPQPDLDPGGSLKDPVKKAFMIINGFGLKARDYEAAASNLRLRLLRFSDTAVPGMTQSFLNQTTYLGSLDHENSGVLKAILPFKEADIQNLLFSLSLDANNSQEDHPEAAELVDQQVLRQRLETFFRYIKIMQLKTPSYGWTIPGRILSDSKPPERLGSNVLMDASIFMESLNTAQTIRKIQFDISFDHEGKQLSGRVPLGNLQVAKFSIDSQFNTMPAPSPFWFYHVGEKENDSQIFLPSDIGLGEGILLPKPFREAGVLLGDRGYISFQTPTASAMQEQRVKVFVAGFYDQGLIPIGGKFVLVNENLTNLISASLHDDQTQSNGINVRFDDLDKASEIKAKLQQAFQEAGIAPYWNIQTYREYDFTKDIIQQLSSDKHLFSLIATVIIIVACSNIISMLIILVNDKKLEIGILRSMGASSTSIAAIFGLCGVVMGVTGSLIGIGVAILTLNHLDVLVNFLSVIQGHDAFNPLYYGDSLPNEVSVEALLYVVSATAVISLLSGLVPALKASMLRPSTILKAE